MKLNKKREIMISIFLLILIFVIVFLVAIMNNTNDKNSEGIKSNKYKTEGTWALPEPYKMAIEIDSYDGDVFKAGEYTFTEKYVNEKGEYTPYIYDIYLSTTSYDNFYDMPDEDILISVGGYGYIDKPKTIKLNAGTYVYIVPSKPIGIPTGVLEIKILN